MLGCGDEPALPLLCYPGRSGDLLRPEARLLAVVLAHAVGIFQRHALTPDRRGRLLFADIDAWFASNAVDYPFAFVSICEVLGLDVASVRSGLGQWRASRQVAFRRKPYRSRLPVRQPALHAVPHLRLVPAPSVLRPARGRQRSHE